MKLLKLTSANLVPQEKLGNALRVWTSGSIHQDNAKDKIKKFQTASYLSTIPGQPFPVTAYRAFGVNPDKITSWSAFLDHLKIKNPESYSSSMNGVKSFIKETGGGMSFGDKSVIFAVRLITSEWMFNLRYLSTLLEPAQLSIKDKSGFSLKQYLSQEELVAKPGSLKRAFLAGMVNLVGHELPDSEIKWLSESGLIRE